MIRRCYGRQGTKSIIVNAKRASAKAQSEVPASAKISAKAVHTALTNAQSRSLDQASAKIPLKTRFLDPKRAVLTLCLGLCLAVSSCAPDRAATSPPKAAKPKASLTNSVAPPSISIAAAPSQAAPNPAEARLTHAKAAIEKAIVPAYAEKILLAIDKDRAGFLDLLAKVEAERSTDPDRFLRVDKSGLPLSEAFVPADLLPLDRTRLSRSKDGMVLRKAAIDALESMDDAARKEGLTLLVSSAYRTYAYQARIFARNVQELGEAAARRESAEPGRSQHQLGTAVDFGSIDDSFAETKASAWLSANATRFGFSLSYPKGLETLSGYRWESWHYRWIGPAAAKLENRFFEGLQHNLMLFLERYFAAARLDS